MNGLIDNYLALVEVMARRRIGDKPLAQSMMPVFTDVYVGYPTSMIWYSKMDQLKKIALPHVLIGSCDDETSARRQTIT